MICFIASPCIHSGFVILYRVYRVSADLGCRACICEDATGQTLPCGVPSLTTALVDCSHLLRLPIWAQILAWLLPPCSPTVSQTVQPCGRTPGGQANCSAPMLPLPRHSCWQEPACCHLVYLLCSHTCFSAEFGFSYKTRFKDKVLSISRWESRALNPELSPF